MARTKPAILYALLASLALGTPAAGALPAQPAGEPRPDAGPRVHVEAAIDAIAAGDLRAARRSIREAKRSGGGEVARVIDHLVSAYRAYERSHDRRTRLSLHRAAVRSEELAEDALLPVLEKVRGSLEESEDGGASPGLRMLLCHLRLLAGEPKVMVPAGGDAPPPDVEEPVDLTLTSPVEPPERIFFLSPQYTEAAQRQRTQGPVVTQAVIDKEGCVSWVKILRDLPFGLDEQAVRVLWWAAYDPATLEGEPVPVFYNLTTTYGLR